MKRSRDSNTGKKRPAAKPAAKSRKVTTNQRSRKRNRGKPTAANKVAGVRRQRKKRQKQTGQQTGKFVSPSKVPKATGYELHSDAAKELEEIFEKCMLGGKECKDITQLLPTMRIGFASESNAQRSLVPEIYQCVTAKTLANPWISLGYTGVGTNTFSRHELEEMSEEELWYGVDDYEAFGGQHGVK